MVAALEPPPVEARSSANLSFRLLRQLNPPTTSVDTSAPHNVPPEFAPKTSISPSEDSATTRRDDGSTPARAAFAWTSDATAMEGAVKDDPGTSPPGHFQRVDGAVVPLEGAVAKREGDFALCVGDFAPLELPIARPAIAPA